MICFNILESTRIMTRAMTTLAERCIAGIEVNRDVVDGYVRHSIGVITALVPVIGYAAATEVASEALETGRPVAELVLERGLLDERRLAGLLSPASMTRPVRPTATGTIPALTVEQVSPGPMTTEAEGAAADGRRAQDAQADAEAPERTDEG